MEKHKSLSTLFQELGCETEDDTIIDKCIELCDSYNISIEKFAELWLTFRITNNKSINLTFNTLLEMEKAILKEEKLDDSTMKNIENQEEETMDKPLVPVKTCEYDETDEVLRIYGCSGSSNRKRKASEAEIDVDFNLPKMQIIDSSSSTTAENSDTPNQHDMTNKEKILISIGKTVSSWKRLKDYNIEVGKSNESHVPPNSKYMYEIISRQGKILTHVCRNMGVKLCKLWSARGCRNTSACCVANVRSISQSYFRTFGRINAKKDTNTVILEGCVRRKDLPAAETIELDFRNMKQYSVFSGQIVAVEVTNPLGNRLYIREIFAKAYAPLASPPKIRSRINVFVAAGPFTASNNMQYQPLWNLMEKVATEQPHILILIGPFLEYTHPAIENVKETYQEIFEKIVSKIMELTKRNTQVVLVPSNRDVHQEPVFPTSQYVISSEKLVDTYPNLRLMPDPCILDAEGLRIGITSVDVIKHIGKEEISDISGMDRLSRLADHILAQTCFYPVYPPHEDLSMDTEMWEKYTFFDEQPHLLILPSDMRCYCKVINNCVTLNPERMYKNTYARLSIEPSIDNEWSSDNISCDIAKV